MVSERRAMPDPRKRVVRSDDDPDGLVAPRDVCPATLDASVNVEIAQGYPFAQGFGGQYSMQCELTFLTLRVACDQVKHRWTKQEAERIADQL